MIKELIAQSYRSLKHVITIGACSTLCWLAGDGIVQLRADENPVVIHPELETPSNESLPESTASVAPPSSTLQIVAIISPVSSYICSLPKHLHTIIYIM